MKTSEFEIGMVSNELGQKIEVINKTEHFTTFKLTFENTVTGNVNESTFKRKEKLESKDNGWLEEATMTKAVELHNIMLYACDFE